MQNQTIKRTETKVDVVHVTKTSTKSFAAVLSAFKELVGSPSLKAIEDAVTNNVAEAAITAMEGKSHFMILGQLDMGAAVPSLKAKNLRAIQYLIGNPLYADKMIRHNIEVGLYVPLRVFIAEESTGTIFNYDLPSSLLGQWQNAEIASTAKELDLLLDKLSDNVLN